MAPLAMQEFTTTDDVSHIQKSVAPLHISAQEGPVNKDSNPLPHTVECQQISFDIPTQLVQKRRRAITAPAMVATSFLCEENRLLSLEAERLINVAYNTEYWFVSTAEQRVEFLQVLTKHYGCTPTHTVHPIRAA